MCLFYGAVGMIIGIFLGMLVTCLCVINRKVHDEYEEFYKGDKVDGQDSNAQRNL